MAGDLRDIRDGASGGERVVQWRIERERGRRLGAPAAALVLALVAGAALSAAPGLAVGLRFPDLVPTGKAYAVRIVLPRSRPESAAQAPSARRAPVEVIAQDAREPAAAESPSALPADTAAATPRLAEKAAAGSSPAKRVAAARRVTGVMPLNYSLAGGAAAGDAIEVEKPVTIGGEVAGRIALRIDGNAKVFVAGRGISALLAAKAGAAAVPKALGDEFVSLENLRAMGIGVRYDAIRDRLVLDPPAI